MSILEDLEKNGIFSVTPVGDKLEFTEECDRWHKRLLTKEEVIQLAEELIALARAPSDSQTK